jgi:uncharacterized membrane protein YkgB
MAKIAKSSTFSQNSYAVYLYTTGLHSFYSWHVIRYILNSQAEKWQMRSKCATPPLNLELVMKVLGNLAVIILVIIGILALIPLVSFGFAIFGGIAVFAIWLLPVWIIATSDQTTGFEKIAWIIAILCLSWFAWVFYFFLAPLKSKQRYYY